MKLSETSTAQTIVPTCFACRSQLYRQHINAGALFEEVGDSAVVTAYTKTGDEVKQAARLALVDLSTLPRVGFKGSGAPGWLAEQGAELPGSPNQAVRQRDNSLIARLSDDEFLILSDLNSDSTLPVILQERWSLDSTTKVYSVPRGHSHCWFALTGDHATATLAKICAVDLRSHKFAEREIAQTSLARVNAIILRNDLMTTPCFFILSEVSSAEYLWDALLDAAIEFGGNPVGIAALRTLEAGKD